MGENELAANVVEHEEGQFGGQPFSRARKAIVEAIAILSQWEELAEIVGPIGPRLSASELHNTIWARPPTCGTTVITARLCRPLSALESTPAHWPERRARCEELRP